MGSVRAKRTFTTMDRMSNQLGDIPRYGNPPSKIDSIMTNANYLPDQNHDIVPSDSMPEMFGIESNSGASQEKIIQTVWDYHVKNRKQVNEEAVFHTAAMLLDNTDSATQLAYQNIGTMVDEETYWEANRGTRTIVSQMITNRYFQKVLSALTQAGVTQSPNKELFVRVRLELMKCFELDTTIACDGNTFDDEHYVRACLSREASQYFDTNSFKVIVGLHEFITTVTKYKNNLMRTVNNIILTLEVMTIQTYMVRAMSPTIGVLFQHIRSLKTQMPDLATRVIGFLTSRSIEDSMQSVANGVPAAKDYPNSLTLQEMINLYDVIKSSKHSGLCADLFGAADKMFTNSSTPNGLASQLLQANERMTASSVSEATVYVTTPDGGASSKFKRSKEVVVTAANLCKVTIDKGTVIKVNVAKNSDQIIQTDKVTADGTPTLIHSAGNNTNGDLNMAFEDQNEMITQTYLVFDGKNVPNKCIIPGFTNRKTLRDFSEDEKKKNEREFDEFLSRLVGDKDYEDYATKDGHNDILPGEEIQKDYVIYKVTCHAGISSTHKTYENGKKGAPCQLIVNPSLEINRRRNEQMVRRVQKISANIDLVTDLRSQINRGSRVFIEVVFKTKLPFWMARLVDMYNSFQYGISTINDTLSYIHGDHSFTGTTTLFDYTESAAWFDRQQRIMPNHTLSADRKDEDEDEYEDEDEDDEAKRKRNQDIYFFLERTIPRESDSLRKKTAKTKWTETELVQFKNNRIPDYEKNLTYYRKELRILWDEHLGMENRDELKKMINEYEQDLKNLQKKIDEKLASKTKNDDEQEGG